MHKLLSRQLPGSFFGAKRQVKARWQIFLKDALVPPRLLVVSAALAASGALCAAKHEAILWLAVPSLCTLGIFLFARLPRACLMLALLPSLFFAYFYLRQATPGTDDLSLLSGKKVIFTAKVLQINQRPAPAPKTLIVEAQKLLFPQAKSLSGKALVTVYGASQDLQEGSLLEITAKVFAPGDRLYPWEPDNKEYLRKQGIFCQATALTLQCLPSTGKAKPYPWAKAFSILDGLRNHLTLTHRKFAGFPEGDLLSSMVLGDRAVKLPDEITKKFQATGLSHVLAASGFNLTIVTGMTFCLCSLVIRCVQKVNLICFLSMVGFVFLAGPSPSIMRAALMCTAALLCRSQFRTLYTPACLAMALLISLVFDPASIADIGMQLSYAATAGIIGGARPLSGLLRSIIAHKHLSKLADGLSVIFCAQASVLPLQLMYFWQIGIFFLPANLLVAPLVECITWLGFASSTIIICARTFPCLETLALICDWLCIWPLKAVLAIVNAFTSFDQSVLAVGPPGSFLIGLYYLALAIFFLALYLGRKRRLTVCLFSLSLILLFLHQRKPVCLIACFPRAVIFINAQNQACAAGNYQNKTINKFVLFHGAKFAPAEKKTLAEEKITNELNAVFVTLPGAKLCALINVKGANRRTGGKTEAAYLPLLAEHLKKQYCQIVIVSEANKNKRLIAYLKMNLPKDTKLLPEFDHEPIILSNKGNELTLLTQVSPYER